MDKEGLRPPGLLYPLRPGYYLSVDPGRSRVLTARAFIVGVGGTAVTVGRRFFLRSAHFERAGGTEHASWRATVHRAPVAEHHAALAEHHAKTASLAGLAQHRCAVAAATGPLRQHAAASPAGSRDAFGAARHSARALNAFWAEVQADADAQCASAGIPTRVTVLCGSDFRSALVDAAIAHAAAMPGWCVLLVGEHRTTAMCHRCCRRLGEMHASGRTQSGIRRCGSLWCAASQYVDRDDNATFNLWASYVWVAMLGAGAGRPPHMEPVHCRPLVPPAGERQAVVAPASE